MIEVLAQIPDPRRREGRRYQLSSLLGLSCAAILCGYRTYGAIAEWTRNYGGELATVLGVPAGRVPCAATFFNAFRALDHSAVDAALGRWAEEVCTAYEELNSPGTGGAVAPGALAIDGKTLRGTAKQGAPGAHLLSAVTHRLGITLGQWPVSEKSNEITAVRNLLQALILEGRVITVDALLTQRTVAQTIRKKGGTT